MKQCLVADSSFFICMANDIPKKDFIYRLMNHYQFCLGKVIYGELPVSCTKEHAFTSECKIIEYDYMTLLKPFLLRDSSHFNDGEYEAIGIAFHILEEGHLQNLKLNYLIIDEKTAYNFVKRHTELGLNNYITRTLGLVRNCCTNENIISKEVALDILYHIKDLLENLPNESKKRPCSLCKNDYKKILIPLITYIESGI